MLFIFFYLAICYSSFILPLHIFVTSFMCHTTCIPYPGRHLFDWSNFESLAWYLWYPPFQNTGTETLSACQHCTLLPVYCLKLLHIHCGLRIPELSDVSTEGSGQHQEPHASELHPNTRSHVSSSCLWCIIHEMSLKKHHFEGWYVSALW